VAVAPDGENVYVTGLLGYSVASFARDANTGALTQLPGSQACVKGTHAPSTTTCAVTGPGLDAPFSVTLSPDGNNAYVSSINGNAIAEFRRDAATGALVQLAGADACIQGELGGDCPSSALGLDGAAEAIVTPNGANVYVDSFYGNAIAQFSRDAVTGALRQLPGANACIENDSAPSATACPTVRLGLWGPRALTASPDGANVYVPSSVANSLVTFANTP
jgi:DNA-binding beta-propeller fold protein YncE